MKYLKLFQNENEYLSYKDSSDYITPNVSVIFENRSVRYQKKIKQLAKVGDIAYWDGSSVKTVPLSSWNTSLGTPVGVVMIGSGFAPDGRVRIISLTNMSYNGDEYIMWDSEGGIDIDSPAPNFEYVPTTDNAGSTTIGYSGYGVLPSDSDSFYGDVSYVDGKTKYYATNDELMEWGEGIIPSPYLGDVPNPAYYQAIEGGNALSDFNGLSNTQLLVSDGDNYHAAHACWNYKDAANSNLQWYLPAMGELGYLMPRFKQINESIQAVGGVPVEEYNFWSSSEFFWDDFDLPEGYAWYLYTGSGYVYYNFKDGYYRVRSVSVL